MPAGKYLYRVLRDDEDPSKGLSARNPGATTAKVSSHVNGLKRSPYISTTASKHAAQAFYWLSVKKWAKKNKKEREDPQKTFKIVEIDKDTLIKENKSVEVIDLSDKSVRDEYLKGNKKLQNYAAKYEEVLVKGFIPANCVKEIHLAALTDTESSSEGYKENDYDVDTDDLVAGAAGMTLNKP
uniref:Clam ADP-ribosylating protein CARP-1 n=1 Tax=Meretrix lamarckii TaxID=157363 RepID=Q0KK23_9BIVA|nr:clam ADP-ribosylating protein CARP-1 [Meretrix lamarckii]